MARIVRVRIKRDDHDVFVATSPDLKGLLVVSKDRDLLLASLIPETIADLYRACGQPAVVARAEDGDDPDALPWVAVPMEIARREMERQAS
jgi:hypothetical protein